MAKLVTQNKNQFMDSGLAFFLNQLTKLDPKMYTPLYGTTYSRDIKFREDVSLSNESTSYILQTIGSGGSFNSGSTAAGGGMPWINSGTTGLTGVTVDGELVTTPLRYLGKSLAYTKLELMKSQETGFPIDSLKFNAINTTYQMGIDQMVYVGDSYINTTGLANSSLVTNSAANASGKTFVNSTPQEILNDFNELMVSVFTASGFAFAPDTILLPFAELGYLSTTPVSTAGSISILEFIKQNCFSTQQNGKMVNIHGVKWLTGIGSSSSDRMVAYTNDYDRIRFPLVPIQGFEPSYHDLVYSRPYVWAMGSTEIVYPETIGYRDGIG